MDMYRLLLVVLVASVVVKAAEITQGVGEAPKNDLETSEFKWHKGFGGPGFYGGIGGPGPGFYRGFGGYGPGFYQGFGPFYGALGYRLGLDPLGPLGPYGGRFAGYNLNPYEDPLAAFSFGRVVDPWGLGYGYANYGPWL